MSRLRKKYPSTAIQYLPQLSVQTGQESTNFLFTFHSKMGKVTAQTASTNCTTMEAKYEQLLRWAEENGSYIHPSLKYIEAEDRGVEALIDPKGKAIKSNEQFLRVSYKLTLSYFNAISAGISGSGYHPHSESLPREFLTRSVDHDTINALFLVQQYLLAEESFWYRYANLSMIY